MNGNEGEVELICLERGKERLADELIVRVRPDMTIVQGNDVIRAVVEGITLCYGPANRFADDGLIDLTTGRQYRM